MLISAPSDYKHMVSSVQWSECLLFITQIENEYGSYHACDHDYMHHLRDLARKYLGETVVLYTTDGNSINDLKCGSTPGAYATVDFGPGGNLIYFNLCTVLSPRHSGVGVFTSQKYSQVLGSVPSLT